MPKYSESMSEETISAIFDHSVSLIAQIDSVGNIVSSNPALDTLLGNLHSPECLLNALVSDSRVHLVREITRLVATGAETRFKLHFSKYDLDLPVSYDCMLVYTSDQKIIFYAEPVPSIAAEQAKEYAVVNSELATVTRELQKANYELNRLNAKIQIKMIEQQKMRDQLDEARSHQLEFAGYIQQTLLVGCVPEHFPGIDIAAVRNPSNFLDGDFFDFYQFGTDSLHILIGDVMGKGLLAALIGAAARFEFNKAVSTLLYESARLAPPTPSEIIYRVHNILNDRIEHLRMFITLNYSHLDMIHRKLQFVDCGHTKTVHYHGNTGQIELISGSNTAIGITTDTVYEQHEVGFESGDVFFFYSDGLIDARSADGNYFDEEGTLAVVSEFGCLGAHDLLDRVMERVMDFTNSKGSSDDLTCIAVKIL